MYLEVQDDKKIKESKVVEQKHNILPAKRDLHSDVHIQYKREPYLDVGIQPKQENTKGTGIIQKEPGLEVGTYVYVRKENKIGKIIKKDENKYDVEMPDVKIVPCEVDEVRSMYSRVNNNTEVFNSVMNEGILSPPRRRVQPGAVTKDALRSDYMQQDYVTVNKFSLKEGSDIESIKAMFENSAAGAYIIAMENAYADKIRFPSARECQAWLRENPETKDDIMVSMNRMYAFAMYIQCHSQELSVQIVPVLEERLRRSMLVIFGTEQQVQDPKKAGEVQETTINKGIRPKYFKHVLLPENSTIPPESVKDSRIKRVSLKKILLKLPLQNFIEVPEKDYNFIQGIPLEVAINVPDYAGALTELQLEPNTYYYSHLVRM